jgi:hypothetical protein
MVLLLKAALRIPTAKRVACWHYRPRQRVWPGADAWAGCQTLPQTRMHAIPGAV